MVGLEYIRFDTIKGLQKNTESEKAFVRTENMFEPRIT